MIDVSALSLLSLVIWVGLLARAAWLVVHPPHQDSRTTRRVIAG